MIARGLETMLMSHQIWSSFLCIQEENWNEIGVTLRKEWVYLVLRSDSQRHNWLEFRFLQPLSVEIGPKIFLDWVKCLTVLFSFPCMKGVLHGEKWACFRFQGGQCIQKPWLVDATRAPVSINFTMYQQWVAISAKIWKDWSLKRSVR